jgi:hypothetical protein
VSFLPRIPQDQELYIHYKHSAFAAILSENIPVGTFIVYGARIKH